MSFILSSMKMQLFHIANAQFEWELTQPLPPPLIQTFGAHPIFMQLQFLPFLYADAVDHVCVTSAPPEEFWHALTTLNIKPAKMHLLSTPVTSSGQVASWGASRSVAAWAKQQRLHYQMPPWDLVVKVNSKLFSFSEAPKLPGAALIANVQELDSWMQKTPHPKVLKTCFGVSGKGHFLLTGEVDHAKLKKFTEREWKERRPLIGEPWVTRLLDFSTQWNIKQEIHYLGATLSESSERGAHLQNRVGEEKRLFGENLSFLEQHREIAVPILQKMKALGFFGNVGIDAMLYTHEGKTVLHPVVEINARKTMGWLALQVQKRHFSNQMLAIRYAPHTPHSRNLLPTSLKTDGGKILHFTRSCTIIQEEEVLN